MSSNAPTFDPLNPTREEADAMLAGYLAGAKRFVAVPNDASPAFEHGWRMRRNDMAGVADSDQREWARLLAARERAAHKRQA